MDVHCKKSLTRFGSLGAIVIFGVATLLLAGCPAAPELQPEPEPQPGSQPQPQQQPQPQPQPQPEMADRDPAVACGASDPRVGKSAALRGYFHRVSGNVRIVDDCTLAIDNFTYDGGGLDVRVYAGRDRSFENGISLTGDIRRFGGYRNETLLVPLPAGVTLDDVRAVAIWCLAVNVNFGDAVLQ